MRKIFVSNYKKEDNLYKVYFNQEFQFVFNSKKKLDAFFSKINKHYNNHLIMLNEQLKVLYTIYRTEYFTMHSHDARTIKIAFETIEKKIHHLISRNRGVNQNYFLIQDFKISYNELIVIASILLAHYKKNSTTSLVYQLKAILINIELLQSSVYEFQQYIDLQQKKSEIIKLQVI